VYSYVAYRIGDGPEAEDVTSDVFERAVLVVRDDRPLAAPPEVTAPDTAVDQAQVATQVQQHQVVESHPGPGRERGQFGPLGGEGLRRGPADGGQEFAAWRPGHVTAQPGQHRPGFGQRGQFPPHVLPQRAERLAVRAVQHDPAQAAQPVLGK
jgi:hypothetical protein